MKEVLNMFGERGVFFNVNFNYKNDSGYDWSWLREAKKSLNQFSDALKFAEEAKAKIKI